MSLKQIIIIKYKCHSLSRFLQATHAKSSQSLGKNNVGLNILLLQHEILCKSYIFLVQEDKKELLSQMQRRLKHPVAQGSDSVKTGLEMVCCRDLFVLLNSEV